MKKYYGLITAGLLATTFAGTIVQANTVCDPDYIFETVNGSKGTSARRATNAAFLQLEGIKGKTKSGQRLKAAIIDGNFFPEYTAELKKKGVIDPAAFSQNLIIDPDEKLENETTLSIFSSLHTLTNRYKGQTPPQNVVEEIHRLDRKFRRKVQLDSYKQDTCAHGSGVMEALHTMAPDAELLPIDVSLVGGPNMSTSERVALSIHEAITRGAHVINLSRSFDLTPGLEKAFEAASQKGIAIVTSAGNESNSILSYTMDEVYDSNTHRYVKNPKLTLFEKLKGKCLRFVGALEYTFFGKEKVAPYSQIPSKKTAANFIFAPGSQLSIRASTNPSQRSNGTSFASPVFAGAYLLMHQYCMDKGYKFTTDEILNLLQGSGRNVKFKPTYGFKKESYKALDLSSAKELADKKHRELKKKVASKKKPAAKKIALKKKAAPKKKTTIAKKISVKKKVAQKRITQKKRLAPQKKVVAAKKKALVKRR